MAAPLWPNETPLAVIRPDPAVYWHVQGLILCALLALSPLTQLLFGASGAEVTRGGWAVFIGAFSLLAPTLFNAWGELRQNWLLTDQRLILPGGDFILLAHLDRVRARRAALIVTTRAGARKGAHLSFLANPAAAAARIERARATGQ